MDQSINNTPEIHWRYRITERLGQGGESEVFLAVDRLTGVRVALKTARNSAPDLKREFIRLYRLDHPGLLAARDYHRQAGTSLAAFEHFPGITLDAYLSQERPDQQTLWQIWLQLAGIVAYLHGKEYIHGDIKPENVLVGRDGAVKLIDLGLARKTGDAPDPGFSGTAEYSAPEVLSDGTGPSQSSDVYSLGLMLFQALTGQVPSAKDRLEENQTWSLRLREKLDEKQSEIAVRALNFWPQERYHSAVHLVQALSQAGHGCPPERPAGFRFSCQERALALAAGHLRRQNPGLLRVYAGPGRGKTAFLKELNFMLQMAGSSTALIDAGAGRLEEALAVIPEDTILLIDNLKGEDAISRTKARGGRTVASLEPCFRERTRLGEAVTLERFQGKEYCTILEGYLPGARNWELANLSDWLFQRAGSNVSHARLLLEHYQDRSLLIKQQGHWQIAWQKIYADQAVPEKIAAELVRNWQSLGPGDQRTLLDACLKDGSEKIGQAGESLNGQEYWFDGRGRIDGDMLRAFILKEAGAREQTGTEPETDPGPECDRPSMSRWLFWEEKGMLSQWLREGQGLLARAVRHDDPEKMIFVGRLLAASGRLAANEQNQLVRRLAGIYQRLNRWSEALELWKTLAGPMSGEWEYYQTLAKLYTNLGEHAPALEALEAGARTVKNANQKCLYLAYKGWVLGLQGSIEDGRNALNKAMELADEMKCSGGTYFEIYNSLARHHHLSNDFKKVAYWAWKASGLETPEAMKRAELLNLLGYSLWQNGDLIQAKTQLERSLSLLECQGQNSLLCYTCCSLGLINISLKNWDDALIYLQKAENHYNINDGLILQSNIIVNIALVYEKANQIQLSKDKYTQASCIYHDISDINGLMISMANAALQDYILGRTDQALKELSHCLFTAQKNNLSYTTAIILKDIGLVNVEIMRYREGLDNVQKAISIATEGGFKIPWDCIYYETLACWGLGDLPAMRGHLDPAGTRAGNATEKAQIKMLEGFYMAGKGDPNAGLNAAMAAADELKESGDPAEAAKAWLKTGEYALACEGFSDTERLISGLLAAEAGFQKMGAPAYLDRTRSAILAAARRMFAPGNIIPGSKMLEGLYQIAALLDPGKNQSQLAQNCLEVTVKLLSAERGGLFLTDENSKLFLAAKVDLDPDTQNDALEFSSNAVMAAASGETMVVSNDAQLDASLSSRLSVKRNAIRSLLCLPLRSREGTLGAIYLDSRLKSGIFNQAQRDFTKALAGILGAVLESHRLLEELRAKSREQQGIGSKALAGMIGNSAAVKNMVKRIRAAAPTDVTVLLDGESGTGKEMAAQIVHQLSARKEKKFLALDCGSLPETLLESELFGYVKGSFTGAVRDKIGLFEAADGGTVFLDEIASASPGVQARLLRVIEAGEIRRVGSENVSQVDVRLVCATNKDLEIEINEGRFREDLFYRLKVIKIDIPPLRERGDDVLILAEHFKNRFQKKHGKGHLHFSEEARRSIIVHSWPGNIRELENTVQKAVLLAQGKTITEKDLEIEGYYPESGQTFKQELNYTQKEKILRILDATRNNYTKAAKIYGVSVRHFYRLLDKFGINRDINVN